MHYALETFDQFYIPEPNSGCWIWLRGASKGYGVAFADGQHILAHRLSWRLHKGVDSVAPCLCHKCDVGLCINPEHLFEGSFKDNSQDREQKGRGIVPDNAGERHGRAKLTAQQIEEIRNTVIRPRGWQRVFADKFGVRHSQISRIVSGVRWSEK